MWEPTCRLQLHKWPRTITGKIWPHLVHLVGSHGQDSAVATRSPLPRAEDGQGGEAIAPVGTCPEPPWNKASSRSNDHRHRQRREYFSSQWIHSITGLSLRSIRLLPCYFITRAPRAEVILTQHFFPSNSRFHSCFQRSWLVCLILAKLTHPARVPWSV